MAIDSINPAMTGVVSPNTKKTDSNTLSMDDFFSLMVAQLSNQDMYNTMDNSQFIAQMAQFSMVQALSDLNSMSMTTYSIGLIGKEVTVAESRPDGTLNTLTGLVESVNLFNGEAKVVVEGKQFDLSSIMIVKEPNLIIPDLGELAFPTIEAESGTKETLPEEEKMETITEAEGEDGMGVLEIE